MIKLYLSCMAIIAVLNCKAQKRADTIKCYVQIMVPASATVGLSKEIEDNRVFLDGGILLYTRAYAISDTSGRYVRFLTPKRKELKNIWLPNEKPVVMKFEW